MSFEYGIKKQGLPYGAIPDLELIKKLEETEIPERGDDYSIDYNNYIRSEIVDWTPDQPYLESDKTRRDSSLSQSILNLRHVGTRGTLDVPSHPEMFMGFMDQDPRAIDNNPRFDQYHDQIGVRLPNIEVRMGNNDSSHTHERPWSNQSLDQCRRDIQTSLQSNTKVFYDEYDGRALNQNIIQDYDHNKKQLIYRDIIPGTQFSDINQGKQSMQYTTKSLPMISFDVKTFKDHIQSLHNTKQLVKSQTGQSRNIENDQDYQQMLTGFDSSSYKLMVKPSIPDIVEHDQQSEDSMFNNPPNSEFIGSHVSSMKNIEDGYVKGSNISRIENRNNTKRVMINPTVDIKLIDTDAPVVPTYESIQRLYSTMIAVPSTQNSEVTGVEGYNYHINNHGKRGVQLTAPNVQTEVTGVEGYNYHINNHGKRGVQLTAPNVQTEVTGVEGYNYHINNHGKRGVQLTAPNVQTEVTGVEGYNYHINNHGKRGVQLTAPNVQTEVTGVEGYNYHINNHGKRGVQLTAPNVQTEVTGVEGYDFPVCKHCKKHKVKLAIPNTQNSEITGVEGYNYHVTTIPKSKNTEVNSAINIVHSNFSIPQYTFQQLDNGKSAIPVLPLVTTHYQEALPVTSQHESQVRNNAYTFTDDIGVKMNNTVTSIVDLTSVTPTRYYKPPEYDNTKASIRTDTEWLISNEHDINKSQKHIRTGTTDDPTLIDLPSTDNYESFKSSGHRGGKNIRGDRIEQDNLDSLEIESR